MRLHMTVAVMLMALSVGSCGAQGQPKPGILAVADRANTGVLRVVFTGCVDSPVVRSTETSTEVRVDVSAGTAENANSKCSDHTTVQLHAPLGSRAVFAQGRPVKRLT